MVLVALDSSDHERDSIAIKFKSNMLSRHSGTTFLYTAYTARTHPVFGQGHNGAAASGALADEDFDWRVFLALIYLAFIPPNAREERDGPTIYGDGTTLTSKGDSVFGYRVTISNDNRHTMKTHTGAERTNMDANVVNFLGGASGRVYRPTPYVCLKLLCD